MPALSQWVIFEQLHISTYARSCFVILGDAAHASTRLQGPGAEQAIEDAHILAELLGNPRVMSTDHVITAFKAYDVVRRPRSQRVVSTSAEYARLFCLRPEGAGDNEEKLKMTLQEWLRWLWDDDVQDQADRARPLMLDKIGTE